MCAHTQRRRPDRYPAEDSNQATNVGGSAQRKVQRAIERRSYARPPSQSMSRRVAWDLRASCVLATLATHTPPLAVVPQCVPEMSLHISRPPTQATSFRPRGQNSMQSGDWQC